NGDYKSEQLETALNYTKGENDKEKIIVSWYQIALKRATWLKPVKDRLTGKLVARYAAPFYKKGDSTRAIGVVVAEFALDSFKPFLQKMNVGKTGYAFIIDTVGTFIYHPKNSLVIKEKTIFDYAQQQINKPLHDIGIKIIRGTKGPFSYTDPLANSRIWLHSAPISQSPWLLVLSFIEEEVTISPTIVRHAYMGILSAFIMIILLLVLLICHIFVTRKILLKVAAFSMGVILLCGLAGLWYIIAQTELQADKTTGDARINNTTMLTAYLEERQREASIKYQHIYTIPTGILIDSLNLDDVKSISFSGYIWQQYDTSVPIDRQITIPGATALSVEKVYEETFGNRVIIGWKVIATIPQRLRYAQYPFDHQDIVIPLSHPEQTKLLLLTPDFDEYEKIGFEKFIGIKRGFSLTEFSLVDTYFTYNSSEQPKPTLNQVTGKNLDLFYTISLTRNILHSFIVYFIPLFVILFTLFAAFVFTKVTDTITSFAIGPYTAPTFALIILHANLRNKFTVGDILYIEYLFFLTYLTILLAIIFNIFIGWQKKKSEKLLFFSSLLKLFFWPVQFALWYGATVISFY
ncbi:MAG: Cache 3/Cache 2 fusion domain-containing protein, partial [bacterium]|nr:Cache 3/Cache 2 fusion domain-containing protein [bacterium]